MGKDGKMKVEWEKKGLFFLVLLYILRIIPTFADKMLVLFGEVFR